MPKTTKRNKGKRIIFSNMESNYNCSEDCIKDGSCDCDYIALEDERINLNVTVPGNILAIADLGLWNGRRTAYKIYNNNIRSILNTESDNVEWYSDGHNIKATIPHHDGTNYVEYRVIREGKDINKLTQKLYNQVPITRQEINYYTESLLPYVAKVYGW